METKNLKKNIPDCDLPYVLMGEVNEKLFTPIIKEAYGEDVELVGNWYDAVDYESPTMSIELKTRSCKKADWYDTMIGKEKLDAGWEKIKQGKRVFFLFGFTDGGWDWELTKERYDEIGGSKCIRIGGIEERGYKKKPYFYIPHKKLDEVCEQGSWVHPVVQAKNEEKKRKYQESKIPAGVCLLKTTF